MQSTFLIFFTWVDGQNDCNNILFSFQCCHISCVDNFKKMTLNNDVFHEKSWLYKHYSNRCPSRVTNPNARIRSEENE